MHVLFVHPNHPAQFGRVAAHLAAAGHRCTFATERPGPSVGGVERIVYKPAGGATERTYYCSRTFENGLWRAHAVSRASTPPSGGRTRRRRGRSAGWTSRSG